MKCHSARRHSASRSGEPRRTFSSAAVHFWAVHVKVIAGAVQHGPALPDGRHCVQDGACPRPVNHTLTRSENIPDGRRQGAKSAGQCLQSWSQPPDTSSARAMRRRHQGHQSWVGSRRLRQARASPDRGPWAVSEGGGAEPRHRQSLPDRGSLGCLGGWHKQRK